MFMFMQHVHGDGRAAWTHGMLKRLNMQHVDMDIKHGYAAFPCSKDMQHGDTAWT